MIRPVAALAALAVALAAAGCGGTGNAAPGSADLANGKKIFQSTCGGCHRMSEAGTPGGIGPDLDFAYVGDRVQGMKATSFESMVREQIANPDPYGQMPANLVKGSDAQDVAAYVASVAGLQLAAQEKTQNNLSTTPE